MKAKKTYEIENNIPIPSRQQHTLGGGLVGSLRRLAKDGKIGQSIFVPLEPVSIAQKRVIGAAARTSAGAGWYAVRTVDGGVRIWKKAEPKQGD